MKKNVLCWTLSAAVTTALVTLSLRSEAFAKLWQMRATYYFMSLIVFAWVYSLIEYLRGEGFEAKAFLRARWPGLVFALFLTSMTFYSLEPALRVLSDETNVLSVSKSMMYEKSAENVTQGLFFYGNFNKDKIDYGTEKHAFLFAYLTHLVHVALGYSADNPFVLNFFVLFAFLALLYLLFVKRFGIVWAFSCMVLVLAQPIVTQSATSGGLDLLSTFFGFLVFHALWQYMRSPQPHRLLFLWMTLIMFANTRQESILMVLIIVALLVVFCYVVPKTFFESSFYALTPLFFMPTFWQRVTVKDAFESGKTAPMSMENAATNLKLFAKGFTDFNYFIPYAVIVNITGAAFLLYCLYAAMAAHPLYESFKKEKERVHVTWITAICMTVQWMLIISYHMGKYDHPSSARYFITVSALFSILTVFLAYRLPLFRKSPSYFLIFAVLMFVMYHPLSIENRFSNAQTQPRKYEWTVKYLKKHASKNSLILVDRPGQYIVHNWGSMPISTANRDKKGVLNNFRRHLYEEMWVIQEISYENGEPTPGDKLDAEFVLRPMANLQNTGADYVRISKVVDTPEQPAVSKAPVDAAAPASSSTTTVTAAAEATPVAADAPTTSFSITATTVSS